MIYTNSKELQGHTLDAEDVLVFNIKGEKLIGEVVYSTQWVSFYEDYNDKIFLILGLDAYDFCSKFYNTSPVWCWPAVNEDNPELGLTKCVIALFKEIERQNVLYELEQLKARVKELEAKIAFDPENPTIENLVFPWMTEDADARNNMLEYVIWKEEELTALKQSLRRNDRRLLPRSEWNKRLIQIYNEDKTNPPLPY